MLGSWLCLGCEGDSGLPGASGDTSKAAGGRDRKTAITWQTGLGCGTGSLLL